VSVFFTPWKKSDDRLGKNGRDLLLSLFANSL